MNGSCTSDQNETRSFIRRSRRRCSVEEAAVAEGREDTGTVSTVEEEAIRATSDREALCVPRAETPDGTEVVSMRPDREPTTRRSATFFSSRTLPGQS